MSDRELKEVGHVGEPRSESDGTPDGNTPGEHGVRGRRVGIWVTVVLLVVVLAGAAVTFIVLKGGGGQGGGNAEESSAADGDPQCQKHDTDTGVTEPESTPDKGSVEIVESGTATAEDNARSYTAWTFGAVAENTADLVATDVTFTVTAVRPDGERAQDGREDTEWKYTETASYILPGQQIALGGIAPIIDKDIEAGIKVDVAVDVAEWWKLDNDAQDFTELTATTASKQRFADSYTEFSVKSTSCDPVDAAVGVIYRNSKGDILAGANITPPLEAGKTAIDYKKFTHYKTGTNGPLWASNLWAKQYDHGDFSVAPDASQTDIYPYVPPTK